MDDLLAAVLDVIIAFIEACGALIITVGVIRAIIDYARLCVFHYEPNQVAGLRVRLGQSMVVALEFQVAADILKTGISPNWEDILVLAAIIAIRTLLNYLLERELTVLAPVDQEKDCNENLSERP